MTGQEKWCAKVREMRNKSIASSSSPFLGTFSTFKEARKNAREIAKITGYYGYIKKESTKAGILYAVVLDDDFNYYVHKDGRVCKVEDLEKEKKKCNRHPEKMLFPHPFSYNVENRKKEEDKKEYKLRMSIQNRCQC